MKGLKIVFIAVVIIVLLVPSVFMLAGYRNPNRENRVLASLPKLFTKDGLNTAFFEKLDDYTEDHFAFRDHLTEGFNRTDIALLGDVSSTNAVIGRDGCIFYGETVNDYLGIEQLTDAEIASITNYLRDVQISFEAKGIRFAFIIAPDKATVYPELMPAYLHPNDSPRSIDLLQSALAESGVSFIDAKGILISAKEKRTVYYMEDSHWNNYGAMLVYNEAARLFGLEEYDAEIFGTAVDRTGDLHSFVYPVSSHNEERIVYPLFHEWSSQRPIDFDRDKAVETASDVNGSTLLVYHDSFGRSLQPIFSQSVGSLFMNSYFPYDLTLADQAEPDFVIIEIVERNLPWVYAHAASLGY